MVFTTAGKNEIRNWLAGTTATAPVAIAVGTSSTSASADDTSLGGEVFRKTTSANTAPQLVTYEMLMSTLDATGSTLAEYGLFNSTSSGSGTMFVRNIFAPIEKTNSVEIQFEQRVEVE